MSDLISREDAIEAMEARIKWFNGDAIEDRCKRDAFIQALDKITELPSADAVQGKWIRKNYHTYICNQCGYEESIYGKVEDYRFCSHCGARMLGEDGEI